MKRLVLLSVITITMSACGKPGSSGGSTSGVTPSPGPLPNQTVYAMTASRSEPGDVSSQASQAFTQSGTVIIPQSGISTADATDSVNATLSFGSVSCTYSKPAGSSTYAFHDCTGGYVPGSQVTFPSNSVLSFDIQSGYCTQSCSAQISVTVTQ